MGGDYYDRDVISTTSTTGFSTASAKVVGQVDCIQASLRPTRWTEDMNVCDAKDPIVFALDVTGSMGNWSKIIYDKMPMFYGQIMLQNYLEDPSISFCAIGDYKSDKAPLQISDFGKGKEIDQLIAKLFLEGKGGGNAIENYEMAAYFYVNHCEMTNPVLPFFFLTGDEGFYPTIPTNKITEIFGDHINKQITSKNVWATLLKKYNVFFLKKHYRKKEKEASIFKQWKEAIGEERIIYVETPKAVIDIILGLIALTSNKKDLKGYIDDMKTRGQDKDRIAEVTAALKPYATLLSKGKIQIIGQPSELKVDVIDSKLNNLTIDSIKESNPIPNDSAEFTEWIKEQVENQISSGDEEIITLYKNLKQMKEQYNEAIPEEFNCPIVKEIMIEPVMAADGYTYERLAIELWLEKNESSPITREKIDKNLIPNRSVKGLIRSFYEVNINNI